MKNDIAEILAGQFSDYIKENGIAHLTLLDACSNKEVIAYSSQPILIVRSGKVISL